MTEKIARDFNNPSRATKITLSRKPSLLEKTQLSTTAGKCDGCDPVFRRLSPRAREFDQMEETLSCTQLVTQRSVTAACFLLKYVWISLDPVYPGKRTQVNSSKHHEGPLQPPSHTRTLRGSEASPRGTMFSRLVVVEASNTLFDLPVLERNAGRYVENLNQGETTQTKSKRQNARRMGSGSEPRSCY